MTLSPEDAEWFADALGAICHRLDEIILILRDRDKTDLIDEMFASRSEHEWVGVGDETKECKEQGPKGG